MRTSHLLPESILTQTDAENLVSWCVHTIGMGYHPDTPAGDYVTGSGRNWRPLFWPVEVERLDRLHEQAFDAGFGDAMYSYGCDCQRDFMGLPPYVEDDASAA